MRAVVVFATAGSVFAMLVVTLLVVLALLFGDSISLAEFLPPFLMSGVVGAVGGGMFAGGISFLGRREGSGRLSYKAAVIAGGLAAFLAPLLIGMVFLNSNSLPPLVLIETYASEFWWLLGLGGAGGAGLNHLARRVSLPSLEKTGVIEAGNDDTEREES